jgi:hypothetical protein
MNAAIQCSLTTTPFLFDSARVTRGQEDLLLGTSDCVIPNRP